MKKCTCFFLTLVLNTQLNIVLHAQAAIPPKYFGINTWMPDSVGSTTDPYFLNNSNYPVNVSGKFYDILSNSTQIQGLGLKNLRYGGTAHDHNRPTIAQYTEFITAAQSLGAEPIIQISFLNMLIKDRQTDSTITTKTCATNYVASAYFTNLIDAIKSNTTYYSIGNEPDLYNSKFTIPGAPIVPEHIGGSLGYFKVISDAIKTMDPGAIIIGPDLAWAHASVINDGDWMEQFIGGSNADITANGVCDIFAFHTYPFDSTASQTRAAIISHPSTTYQNQLTLIRNRITNNSNNANLKIAVTELNVDWRNRTANTVTDISANSYLASQWLAEMLAIGLNTPTGKAPIEFIAPWSVHEADGNGTTYDLGILNGAYPNQTPRSTHYLLQMLAANFKGTYKPNLYTGNSSEYKAFGYKNTAANEVGVVVMNQKIQNPRGTDTSTDTLRINFNNTAPTAASNMKFYFNDSTSAVLEYNCSITNETTMLLVFDITTGALKKRQTYSLQDALRTTDTGTLTAITDSTEYYNYTSATVHSNITIGTGSSISAGANKTFKATNSIRLTGPFSSNGQTLRLEIDQTCP